MAQNYTPVPLDQAPIPQLPVPDYKPAQLSPQPQDPGIGYAGKTGKVADIAGNFLQGFVQGKQNAAAMKIKKENQSMAAAWNSFQNDQAKAAQVINDPDSTPDQKKLAEDTRQKSYKGYLDIIAPFVAPEKGKTGSGKKQSKAGSMGDRMKQAIGIDDPHVISQVAFAAAKASGPPPLPQKSSQEKLADLQVRGAKQESMIVDQLADLRSQPETPENLQKIDKLQQQLKDIRGQQDSIRAVTTGQPIPGESIGKEKGTFWYPQIDTRSGQTTGYVQTGAPKAAAESAADKLKENTIQSYMDVNKVDRATAQKWYDSQIVRQMNQKGQPTTSTSTTVQNTPDGPAIVSQTKTQRSKGGEASPLSPTPSAPAGSGLPATFPGQVVPGSIDLNNRPLVHNADGSISSEYSVSFQDDKGREVLVPTVVDGKFLTPDGKKPPVGSAAEKEMFKRAEQHYRETGQHLGIFDNPKDADAAAEKIHNRQDPRYQSGSPSTQKGSHGGPPEDLAEPLPWAVPKEGRTAIRKAETDYQNAESSYNMAQQTLARIQKDPSYAAQGDIFLLSQHIGMTLHQAGVRPTKTMWEEAIKSRPWLQGVQVRIEGGLVTGATLTPQQRQQMVEMMGDRERTSRDAVNDEKARYGVMVKVQSPDGTVGYVDKKTYDTGKDTDYKGFTVIPVE